MIIDGGTTSAELVRQLPANLNATIVTHSPSVAVGLVDHPTVEVILIGGRLYKHSIVSVGAAWWKRCRIFAPISILWA